MRRFRLFVPILWVLLTLSLAGCGSGAELEWVAPTADNPVRPTPAPVTLIGLSLSPRSPAIARGTVQEFVVEGSYSDGSFKDLTAEVQWSSSEPEVASIEGPTARGLQSGQTAITVAFGGQTDQTVLTVTPASLERLTVEGGAARLPVGARAQFRALGVFSDGTTQNLSSAADWRVEPSTAAEVEGGAVLAHRTGPARVLAVFDGSTAEADFEVTDATLADLRVETVSGSGAPTVDVGQTLALKAVATYSDESEVEVTESATWLSGDPDLASVLEGAVTGIAPGSLSISAEFGEQAHALEITVLEAPLPNLHLSAGTYLFDTDSGELAPEGDAGDSVPGWNAMEGRLILDRFTLAGDATLKLTGSRAFKVKASGSIEVAGRLEFPGAHGADGVDGAGETDGTDGEPGQPGGELHLFTSGELTIGGTIDVRGGDGGQGGDYTRSTSAFTVTYLAGHGGRGGDSGVVTLLAGETLDTQTATILDSGGRGGNGGAFTVNASTSGHLFAGDGGAGGRGESQGGAGGHGGSLLVGGSLSAVSSLTSGAGGDGGYGGVRGGHGGDLSVGRSASGFTTLVAGRGGHGGDSATGDGEAGDGGHGGDIEVGLIYTGNHFGNSTAGEGGRGGHACYGGQGGHGGSVTIDLDNGSGGGAQSRAGGGGDGGFGRLLGGRGGQGGAIAIGSDNLGLARAGAGGHGGASSTQTGHGGDGGGVTVGSDNGETGTQVEPRAIAGAGGAGDQGGDGGSVLISGDNITVATGGDGGPGELQGGNGGDVTVQGANSGSADPGAAGSPGGSPGQGP